MERFIFLLPLPVVLLVLLVLASKLFKKEGRAEKLHAVVGQTGVVVDPIDRYSGAIVIDSDNTILFCASYDSVIYENETVVVTEYDFRRNIFKVERSPQKIFRY